MYRKKRTSRFLKKAELRSAGLKAIDPSMDFGDAWNLQNMTLLIDLLRTKVDAYNTALSVINSSKTEIDELEKNLSELSEKMLIGVALKYGKNSREYEMVSGVRKSEPIRTSTMNRFKSATEASGENAQTS